MGLRKEKQPSTKASLLHSRLSKNAEDRDLYVASNLSNDWRYIDFSNPMLGTPCIALEYLYGSRGILSGRMVKLEAQYGVGKSSFMFYMYGCGQRMQTGAWCYHAESEAAPPPPDFIASFGTDPTDLEIEQPRSLEACLNQVDDIIAQIRGGFGGMMGDSGKMKKTTYDDPLDAANKSPILIGIDSLSGLGLEAETDVDVLDLTKRGQVGSHSSMMGRFFRDRMLRFKRSDVLLMVAAQQKANISLTPTPGMKQTTTIANSPIGYHATYVVEMKGYGWKDDKTGESLGDRIMMKTTKNKVSPKNHEIDMYLRRNKGFDLVQTDITFLAKNPASPLSDNITLRDGKVKCPMMGIEQGLSPDEFLHTIYSNPDLIQQLRQHLRIRGFNFPFEREYAMQPDTEEAESLVVKDGVVQGVADGVA